MNDDAAVQAAAKAIQEELDGSITTDGKVGFAEYFGERAARAAVEAVRPIIAWEMMQEILADLRAARDDANRLAGKLSSLGVDIGDAALRAGAQMPRNQ